MRKIVSKKEEAKREKKKQIVLSIFLIFIMLFSVLGYGFVGRDDSTSSDKIQYRGYELENSNGFWILDYSGTNFIFTYNPKTIQRISANLNPIDSYLNKPLYIYSENYQAESEISVNLNKVAQRIQKACLEGEECNDGSLPIKTCEDNFIIIRETNESSLYQQDNCVFIEENPEELVERVDDFLLNILGI